MSLKTALLALANNIGMCQENARSIKQALAVGLTKAAFDAPGIDDAISSKKLWVNMNPASAFPATDVTVDNSDDFDAFIVAYSIFTWSGMSLWFIDKSAINDNANHTILDGFIDTSNGVIIRSSRIAKLTQAEGSTSVKFAFTAGTRSTVNTYGTAATTTDNNTNMVPQYIIGIKF